LNCVANNRILEETEFKELFIQPAAGDAGGALGAACYAYYSLLNKPRNYIMTDAYLGPEFSADQTRRALVNRKLNFKEFDEPALFAHVASILSRDKIVGWVQGRMEFGPRALGNRSILASPRNPEMKELLNSKVKKRESFRPYAPVVLEERANDFFEFRNLSPFMLLSPRVREDKKTVIPAVTHVDGSARMQTVNKSSNPRLWQLIKEFEGITGIPVIINTSFNLKGEPIVCSPEEAIDVFLRSQMDYLVIGNYVVEKE